MPNFIVNCVDGPDRAHLRAEARSEHLSYIESMADRILLVGPLLDEQDGIVGSMYLIEADDIAGARAFVEADPFAKVGLFKSVDTSRFRIHMGKLA